MKETFDKGPRITAGKIQKGIAVDELIDRFFNAYNAARLAEACRLLEKKVLSTETVLGVSLTGALTPAGLGTSSLVTWIENGWIDYLVTTGANLYHDLHFGLNLPLHKHTPFVDDRELRKHGVIRIYDIVFDFDVLAKSDKYLFHILAQPEFKRKLGSAELHYLIGKYVDATEKETGSVGKTILAAAYRNAVPVFCPSPGDSTIGLNAAALELTEAGLEMDPVRDVNESTSIALHAKRSGTSGVLIFGGGSPKNFMLQTIPLLDEIMEIHVAGHDYFIQITDARPDTGGLSGATPHEAVSWGKVNPEMIPDTVVGYMDSTIAIPLMTAYLLNRVAPRKPKRLYERREELYRKLAAEYEAARKG
ncbi:MAG: deoxyhypusine synthase [Nitrospinae bacterium]|nr:deoxyhypusine synthase [Nitrospinota bacterium]